jgi:thioesterase domain-containing protein
LAAEARECLAEMRRVQPRGPWFLAGLCVGGNLAFEVARQLGTAGEPVPMLVLADCARPRRLDYLRRCLSEPLRGHRQYAMNSLYLALPFARSLLTADGRRRWLRGRAGRGERAGAVDAPAAVAPAKEWEWRAYQHGEGVLRRQMTPPRGRFAGRIDLVLSRQMAGDAEILAWRENAAAGAEVLVLPGSHSTYLVEGAPRLAALYRDRIDAWLGRGV